ncbi:MAG: hypothetical protein U5L09_00495 [Bacteroidales bacterium]|nr:hypothetical protein [Bacteroidales bacterium]
MRDVGKQVDTLRKNVKENKSNLYVTVSKLEEQDVESGHNYAQASIIETNRSTLHIRAIYDQAKEHAEDNRQVRLPSCSIRSFRTFLRLSPIRHSTCRKLSSIITITTPAPVMQKNEQLLTKIEMLRKTQVKRIKKEKDNTKRSLLYLAILFETKNMITDTLHVLKIEQRFIGNIDGDKLLANTRTINTIFQKSSFP